MLPEVSPPPFHFETGKGARVMLAEQSSSEILTDDEAVVLTAVRRSQPVSRQTIALLFDSEVPKSPIRDAKLAKPLIDLLCQKGMIDTSRTRVGLLETEHLSCNGQGVEALRQWVRRIEPSDLLPQDSIRTKIRAFDLLSFEERISWIQCLESKLNAMLFKQQNGVQRNHSATEAYANDDALSALRARLDWLSRVMFDVVKQQQLR